MAFRGVALRTAKGDTHRRLVPELHVKRLDRVDLRPGPWARQLVDTLELFLLLSFVKKLHCMKKSSGCGVDILDIASCQVLSKPRDFTSFNILQGSSALRVLDV